MWQAANPREAARGPGKERQEEGEKEEWTETRDSKVAGAAESRRKGWGSVGQGQEVPEEGLLRSGPQTGLCSGAVREDIHQEVPTYGSRGCSRGRGCPQP